MFNLFDILQAQGGPDMQALGRQYGLSPSQSRSAMEALLPALAIGLQKNFAADPIGLGRLFGVAGPDAGGMQPEVLLSQLFGSPAISQAVLQQAAAASGIGTQALRQMLPVMAGMVVAGIVHVMLNQNSAPAPAKPAAPKKAEPDFSGMSLWNDWLDSFQAATPSTKPKADSRPKARDVQDAEIVPPPPPAKEPVKGKAADSAGTTDDPSLAVFQQMFETGVHVQEQNAKAMQDIFDSFWRDPQPEPKDKAPPAEAASVEPARHNVKPARAAKPAKT